MPHSWASWDKMIRIALAQINPTVGDLDGNRRKIIQAIKNARQQGADIVATPEMGITGYPPEDLLLKKYFVRDNARTLHSLISETKNIVAIVGFVDHDKKGQLYNAAAVMANKKLRGIYYKQNLPNYGVFDEQRYFVKGSNNLIFKIGLGSFGVSICEDIWSEQSPALEQAKAGASFLINISSSPYHAGKAQERQRMLSKLARQFRSTVAYVNLVGGQDELVFDGASMIVDPQGKVVAFGKQFEEDMVVADCEIKRKKRITKKKIKSVSISWRIDPRGRIAIKGKKARRLKRWAEIYQALVLGTRDYIHKNGFQKVVIGLSGGIDSALSAAIACDAIGKENVVGVSLPSRFTSIATRLDARRLAANLGMNFKDLPIYAVHSAYLKALRNEFKGTKSGIAEENIQARIRGNILMALSNKFGWLVLTTGNKSEFSVGYCTLYGDMAGGFCVLKDIPKTLVYKLAKYKNDSAKTAVIPQSIIKRPPTAELRANQKDQDSLPPYSVLDAILEDYIEHDRSSAKIQKKRIGSKVVTKVIRMVDDSEYKRRQSAPGIKITPKSFGRDRRLPITNRYKEKK